MNDTITDKQAISTIILSILGSSIVLGTARAAKGDAWISIILAVTIALIIGFFYARLLSNFHGKNLFEICEIVFGKVFGKIFIIAFTWYALFINAFIIRDIGEFMSITGIIKIRELSEIFTMTLTMLLCIQMAKKNISVFGRFCVFFLPVVIFLLLMGYVLSINNMSPENLLPVMYDGVKPVIDGMLSSLSFPFTESIVFVMIFSSLQNKTSVSKVFTKGVLFAGLMLFFMTIFDIMILGPNTLGASYFPTYASLKRISIGTFLERIEIIIILSFVFGVFAKSTCYLIAASKGIACLFNLKDYTFICTPIGFIVVSLAYLFYENTKEYVETAKFDTLNGIFFQVILFFVVFIGAEIKLKRLKKV